MFPPFVKFVPETLRRTKAPNPFGFEAFFLFICFFQECHHLRSGAGIHGAELAVTDAIGDALFLSPCNSCRIPVTCIHIAETCNRAQIATFLWAAKGKHAVSDLNGFSDVNASDWYATAIGWAKENGITDGVGDGMFAPMDPCTRAQVVTFLKKAYE